MSTNDAKRSAYDGGSTAESSGGGGNANNSSAAMRLKTDGANTDPISGALLNPDILSKALRCIDVSEVLPVAQTCKIWNQTLESVEHTLWKGLVAKHNPTLVQITDMLPDDVGEGQAPKTMKANSDGTIITVPPPSKNWKDQMKRHVILHNSDYELQRAPLKSIDSYIFEIRCKVKLRKVAGDNWDSDVIETIDLRTASISEEKIKLPEITIPDSADAKNVQVLASEMTIIDKTTGRLAVIPEGEVQGTCQLKDFVWANLGDDLAKVDCTSRQRVQKAKRKDYWALTISIDFLVTMRSYDDSQMIMNLLENYQILQFLQNDLNWN